MTKVLLTQKQLDQQASIIADSIENIAVIMDLIDFYPSANTSEVQRESLLNYVYVKKSLTNVYSKLQTINRNLDDVASIIYNASNQIELVANGLSVEDSQNEVGE